MSSTSLRKIKKAGAEKPTELESKVAQAIFDLEVNSSDIKDELQVLHFVSAKEVKVNKTKKALLIFVPEKQVSGWRRLHVKLVRELEKKFSGLHVLFIGQRRASSKPTGNVRRPIRRALSTVQEDLLNDVCYPVEIVGKRIRTKLDGSVHQRVQLDAKEKQNFDAKLHTFAVVYRMLTGKRTQFHFDV
jgi:small subunit ribosomal protein S7e